MALVRNALLTVMSAAALPVQHVLPLSHFSMETVSPPKHQGVPRDALHVITTTIVSLV